MRTSFILVFLGVFLLSPAAIKAEDLRPTRDQYLAIAKKGWVFEFRSSLMRRDPDTPPVLLNGRTVATGAVCIFGAQPHPQTRATLVQFERLLRDIFRRDTAFTFAGSRIADCPTRQRIYLRLYDGFAPAGSFNADLQVLDQYFDFDLPKDRFEPVRSPAQGIGFFGRRGNVGHLLIRQSEMRDPTALQQKFYRSILVEELFQIISYGVDILKFDRKTPFLSKLQEHPTHLKHLQWGSEAFMQGLLDSNPAGLCGFDLFMLHALSTMDLESSNSPAFLEFIIDNFDDLLQRTELTLANDAISSLFDANCALTPSRLEPEIAEK